MDLGGWLRSLGLEKYEAAFRENEIDDTVLPSLTAEDLKELGVGPSASPQAPRRHRCAARRPAQGSAATQRHRRLPRASLPKTAPSAAKSR